VTTPARRTKDYTGVSGAPDPGGASAYEDMRYRYGGVPGA